MILTPDDYQSWKLKATVIKNIPSTEAGASIEPFTLSNTLSAEYLAIGVLVENSKKTWRDGGFVAQAFNFSSTGYDVPRKGLIRSQDLLIDNVTIVKFPIIPNRKYTLYYFPNNYFDRVRIQVWEYIGESEANETKYTSLNQESLDSISQLVESSVINNQIDVEQIASFSEQEKLEIITQLSQIDAGIYTLAEGLATLLPDQQATQLLQNTKNRLDLNMGFL